ncbi:hypothetical protein FACS1894193_08550 [Bacilli bacterium]|nr:hypothetical protein FACS1894192_00200 [Bacilli bacterium]GHU42730.1 hypothetical protein FACS1894193_08550 [Bacilli bacterium]
MRLHPVINERATVEYNDNHLSLFVAQKGKCAVTGQDLILDDMHCHHKRPWFETRDDSYRNLTLIGTDVHKLVQAKRELHIKWLMKYLSLTDSQLIKLNRLRECVGNFPLDTEYSKNIDRFEQMTLF